MTNSIFTNLVNAALAGNGKFYRENECTVYSECGTIKVSYHSEYKVLDVEVDGWVVFNSTDVNITAAWDAVVEELKERGYFVEVPSISNEVKSNSKAMFIINELLKKGFGSNPTLAKTISSLNRIINCSDAWALIEVMYNKVQKGYSPC